MTSCTFSETGIAASHPLLGPLEINRGGVTALERQQPDAEDHKEK